MTTASTNSWSPSVDEIITQGAQLAGIVPMGRSLSADQQGAARNFMQSTLKSLATMGIELDQTEDLTLDLTTGRAAYTLSGDTVDVIFPMMTAQHNSTSQLPVYRYTWGEYQQVTTKTSTGRPVACYVKLATNITLTFWPVPEQPYTLSYRRTRLIMDATAGTTPDLRVRFTDALVWTMAHKIALASSLGVERVKYLEGKAEDATNKARNRDSESGDLCIVPVWGYR